MLDIIIETFYKSITTLITAWLGIKAVTEARGSSPLVSSDKIKIAAIALIALITIGIDYNSNKNSHQDKADSDSEKTSLNNQITSLKVQNDSLKLTVNNGTNIIERRISAVKDSSTQLIHKLETDNLSLSTQLTKSSIELNQNILGKGYLNFRLIGTGESDSYTGAIESMSKYPIYDSQILITDPEALKSCDTATIEGKILIRYDCYHKNTIDLKLKTMPPYITGDLSNNYTFKSKEKYKALEIRISTRNTHYMQQVIFELKRGTCPQAYRIYSEDKSVSKLIKSVNEINYPMSEWNKIFLPAQHRFFHYGLEN